MDKLSMCRICLVEDVRMFSIENTNLQETYERLTLMPFETKDCRPLRVCYICRAKLRNCHQLQLRSLLSEQLFSQMQMMKNNMLSLRPLQDNNRPVMVHPLLNTCYQPGPTMGFDEDPLAINYDLDIKEELPEDDCAMNQGNLLSVGPGYILTINPQVERVHKIEDDSPIRSNKPDKEDDIKCDNIIQNVKVEDDQHQRAVDHVEEGTDCESYNKLSSESMSKKDYAINQGNLLSMGPGYILTINPQVEDDSPIRSNKPDKEDTIKYDNVAQNAKAEGHQHEGTVGLIEEGTDSESYNKLSTEAMSKKMRIMAGTDTDFEYESGAPRPSAKKKLPTEIVQKNCVTSYLRQDYKASGTQSTFNESVRDSPLRIIGDIAIEYDKNQMEVDADNTTVDHVQKPKQITGDRLNKVPKTSAERGREFRARQALLKQQSKLQQDTETVGERCPRCHKY